jgi:hypothetical protein
MNMSIRSKKVDSKDGKTLEIYLPAEKPTMYFIGVTTGKSSIMRVFPEWVAYLKLGDCQLKGIDFRPHDAPEAYRKAVDFIKHDPQSLGALVTTHKIDLLKACKEMFDEWIQVIAEVFHLDLPTKGPVFEELSTIAAKFRS